LYTEKLGLIQHGIGVNHTEFVYIRLVALELRLQPINTKDDVSPQLDAGFQSL
jgi:hypothetical protein